MQRLLPPAVLLALGVSFSSWGGDAVFPRALVIDKGSRSLALVSLRDGNIRYSEDLGQRPQQMLVSLDDSKMAVIAEKAKGGSAKILSRNDPHRTIYFIDTRSLSVLSRTAIDGCLEGDPFAGLRDGIQAWWNTQSTRFTIVVGGCAKFDSELIQIDAATGKVVGRITLANRSEVKILGAIAQTGRWLALAYLPMRWHAFKKWMPDQDQPSRELLIVNLDDLNTTKHLSMYGMSVPEWGDGRHLFLRELASGGDLTTTKSLTLVSCDSWTEVWKESEGKDYAVAPSGTPGEFLIAVLGRGQDSAFMALRENKIAQRVALPDSPRRVQVSSKTRRAYIVCSESIQVVDLVEFKLIGSIATPHLHPSVWSGSVANSNALRLTITKSEDKGYLTYEGDDEISVLDLRNFATVKTFRLESGASKFGKLMLRAAAAGAISGLASSAASAATGTPTMASMPYSPFLESNAASSAVLDGEERSLYLLQPDGVSVVDTVQFKKSHVLDVFDGKRVVSPSFLVLQDQSGNSRLLIGGSTGEGRRTTTYTAYNLVSGERLSGSDALRYDLSSVDGGRYAADHNGKELRLRDPKSLEIVKSFAGFESARQVVWLDN